MLENSVKNTEYGVPAESWTTAVKYHHSIDAVGMAVVVAREANLHRPGRREPQRQSGDHGTESKEPTHRLSLPSRFESSQAHSVDQNWEHDHVNPPAGDNEEEIYTVLRGTATLRVAGEEHLLEPGVFVRVGAAEKRKVETGTESAHVLCIGGTPGQVYEPLPIVELGGPESM